MKNKIGKGKEIERKGRSERGGVMREGKPLEIFDCRFLELFGEQFLCV